MLYCSIAKIIALITMTSFLLLFFANSSHLKIMIFRNYPDNYVSVFDNTIFQYLVRHLGTVIIMYRCFF